MVERLKAKRAPAKLRTIKLSELSLVDNPANPHARVTLFKRDVSSDERDKLAEDGKALPDGSFPIATRADLANAIQAFGRAKDKAKAKCHIIARARALDAVDTLPEGWSVSKGEDDQTLSGSDLDALEDLYALLSDANKAKLKELLEESGGDLPEFIKAQARVPAGNSHGGEFASGGGGGGAGGGGSRRRGPPKLRRDVIGDLLTAGRQAARQESRDKRIAMANEKFEAFMAEGGRLKKVGDDTRSPASIAADVTALDFKDVLAADEAIQATYQVKDEVWRHWNALQRSFETIAADNDVEAAAKVTAMRESLNQFITSLAEETRDDVTGEEEYDAEDITKVLSAVPALAGLLEKEEGDEPMTAAEKQQLDELQKTVADLTKQLKAATEAEPAKKATELATALEAAQAQVTELTEKMKKADADKAEALAKAGMSDAEKEYCSGMDDAAKKSFMDLSSEDRKKKMQKSVDDNPVVYKSESSGEEFRKSDDPRLVTMAKRVDEETKVAKAEREKRENAEFAKRADEDLKPFSDEVAKRDDKIEIMRAIDKMADGPKTALLKMLEVGGKAINAAFQTIGHKAGDVAKSAQAFEKHVSDIQSRDKCSRSVAMTKARAENPEAFEAYQDAGSPAN